MMYGRPVFRCQECDATDEYFHNPCVSSTSKSPDTRSGSNWFAYPHSRLNMGGYVRTGTGVHFAESATVSRSSIPNAITSQSPFINDWASRRTLSNNPPACRDTRSTTHAIFIRLRRPPISSCRTVRTFFSAHQLRRLLLFSNFRQNALAGIPRQFSGSPTETIPAVLAKLKPFPSYDR